MAKEQSNKRLNILTDADRTKLEELGQRIDESTERLELLKDLGIGVGELASQLKWAKRRRDILLDRG